jgi:lauroyl/myristoyl acyltransferase
MPFAREGNGEKHRQMSLINLIFSRFGPLLGLTLVRILPRKYAFQVGEWIVSMLMKQRGSDLYQAVRANQAVIRGWAYEDERLHKIVGEVLSNSAQYLIDWFRTMAFSSGLEDLPCSIDEALVKTATNAQAEGHGVIVVGGHLSSYNMLLMKIAQRKWPVQILSYAEEEGSYRSDNVFRKRFGLNVTPISTASLRQAYRRLKSGGFVLTGVDRPDTGGEMLSFFGRSVVLPIGHARLALRTGARLMVVAVQRALPATYQVVGTGLTDIDEADGTRKDARRLAQEILDQIEHYIKQRPSEWMMFIPVWPEVIPQNTNR